MALSELNICLLDTPYLRKYQSGNLLEVGRVAGGSTFALSIIAALCPWFWLLNKECGLDDLPKGGHSQATTQSDECLSFPACPSLI